MGWRDERMACVDLTSVPPARTTVGQLLSAADALANRVANSLGDYDRPSVVAACVEDGVLLIVVQLAVLSAGCAFLLVDPALPRQRVDYMLSDSNAVLMLLDSSLSGPEISIPCMEVFEHAMVEVFEEAEGALGELFTPQLSSQLMYICYTSG